MCFFCWLWHYRLYIVVFCIISLVFSFVNKEKLYFWKFIHCFGYDRIAIPWQIRRAKFHTNPWILPLWQDKPQNRLLSNCNTGGCPTGNNYWSMLMSLRVYLTHSIDIKKINNYFAPNEGLTSYQTHYRSYGDELCSKANVNCEYMSSLLQHDMKRQTMPHMKYLVNTELKMCITARAPWHTV